MKKLMQLIFLTILLLVISGCNNIFDNLNTPSKPKINTSIEAVDFSSIKSIPDMTSIGFEWQKVNDPRVAGYNFYRTDLQKNAKTLKLVKAIDNRFATHYVDKDLEPGTKYAYQISSRLEDGTESATTEAYVVETLPRIPPVSFAQAISDMPNRVKIIWKPHPDNRVEYYRVEKYNTLINQWVYQKTINQRLSAEYVETGLDNNTTYKYRVKAFTFDNVESAPTPVIVAKTKAAPQGPINVRISNNIPKKIFLTWDASPTPDVVKYEIQKSTISSFGYIKAGTATNTLEYTDSVDEDGKTYYYKVIAIDKDGLESSSNIEAVKGVSLSKPARPTLTSAQLQGGVVVLNWKPNDSKTTSYTVHKKVKENFFEYKLIKYSNVSDTRFEDTDVVAGGEYKYSIVANDDFGLSSDNSDESSITIPKR